MTEFLADGPDKYSVRHKAACQQRHLQYQSSNNAGTQGLALPSFFPMFAMVMLWMMDQQARSVSPDDRLAG
jgi:hypothetical protein